MTLLSTRKIWRQNFLPFWEKLKLTEDMGHYTTKEACYFPFLNLYFRTLDGVEGPESGRENSKFFDIVQHQPFR